MQADFLQVEQLGFAYGKRQVVAQLSLTLARGQFACLLGPSGSGKTTLLRLIAGLETPTTGRIALGDAVLTDKGVAVPPEARGMGMVFQQPTLFPTLSAYENVAFGLRHLPAEQRQQRVHDMLTHAAIADVASHYPHQLSGGQQHRVALARALAPNVQLLLLDEPFSHLDPALRWQLGHDTRALARHEGTTCLMVTHDAAEAMQLSDVIFLMDESGTLHQSGSPHELYHHPANAYAAQALGDINLLPAVAQGDQLDSVLGRMANPSPHQGKVVLGIRPEQVQISTHADDGVEGTVVQRVCSGATDYLTLQLADGHSVRVAVAANALYAPGQAIRVAASSAHVSVFG